ncbi:MAG TPA: 7-cyano-7-deazaguanine synthase QueC [Usitatibacter sp.]|jgi:7-cyano-7-deazaguanine synthase|nr:7-cyano-7-deazaguanine synthase QueC [Usitatibacter sp.]
MADAVVLVSGGLDSATVLAIARRAGWRCHALSIDYGQRHRAELDAAGRVARAQDAADHRIARVDLGLFGGSALTDPSIAVPTQPTSGIPVTYVPARNTVFLALALAYAEVTQADAIFTGANAVDYSGYPDCRPEFMAAFERVANLATKRAVEGAPIRIESPIIAWSKAQIVRHGHGLGVDYSLTVSCYNADDEGRACGRCDSCRLRRAGFEEAGLPDPTRYQARVVGAPR